MHQPGEGEQRLVGGDVGGRLLAPDVLLARLQGQHIAAVARGVDRLADDPARQPPDELRARGEEAVVRAAVAHRVAGRLALADRHRAAVVAGRFEHAERHEVDVRDRHRPGVVRGRGQLWSVLQDPEEVRLLEDHRRRVTCRVAQASGVGRAAFVRHLDHLEPEAGRIGLHDLAHLRVRRLGDDDLRLARRVLGDEAGVGGHGRSVVAGGVRDVHAGELADRGLVLEDRLQHALAHLGLVRRVRRQQLAALEDGVDDGGHVVVVDAGAEEADLVDDVLAGELLQVALQLGFRERRSDVERAAVAHRRRNVAEELVDGRDADRREHRVAVGIGQREVAHARLTPLPERSCTPRDRAALPARRDS